MPIDLNKLLRRQLATKQGGELFTFEREGDQVICRIEGRRTVQTKRGEPADIIDCQILAGEKVDAKSKKPVPVQSKKGAFFLSTHLQRLFDEEKPGPGDVVHIRLSEIGDRRLKLYGFEIVERAAGNSDTDDDLPDFRPPKK